MWCAVKLTSRAEVVCGSHASLQTKTKEKRTQSATYKGVSKALSHNSEHNQQKGFDVAVGGVRAGVPRCTLAHNHHPTSGSAAARAGKTRARARARAGFKYSKA